MNNSYNYNDDDDDILLSSRQVIEEMSTTHNRIHDLLNNLDNISKVLLSLLPLLLLI